MDSHQPLHISQLRIRPEPSPNHDSLNARLEKAEARIRELENEIEDMHFHAWFVEKTRDNLWWENQTLQAQVQLARRHLTRQQENEMNEVVNRLQARKSAMMRRQSGKFVHDYLEARQNRS